MSAAFRDAIRELEDAIERSYADLAEAVGGITDIDTDDILGQGDDGVTRIDGEALRELLNDVADAEEGIANALKDHDWEIRQALRRLKKALVRETASSPSPVSSGDFLDELDPNELIAALSGRGSV